MNDDHARSELCCLDHFIPSLMPFFSGLDKRYNLRDDERVLDPITRTTRAIASPGQRDQSQSSKRPIAYEPYVSGSYEALREMP